MAHLSSYRFEEPLQAFIKTGLDFAGPYEIKVGRCKVCLKIYILVFTCLQVRAIHLEVTETMDTRAFTNALTRFVAIRGMPTDILSDNWKIFISDDKELEGWVRKLDQDANVKWHLAAAQGTWKIAVVRQVFPSVDELVRKVEIENNKNQYIRPITVICPLDVNIEP